MHIPTIIAALAAASLPSCVRADPNQKVTVGKTPSSTSFRFLDVRLTLPPGSLGALPIWLVVLIAVLIAAVVLAFGWLLWRKHKGNPETEEIYRMEHGASSRKGSDWSSTKKPSDPVFAEGSMLAEAGAGGSSSLSRSKSIRSARSGNSTRREHRNVETEPLPRKSSEYPSMDRRKAQLQASGRSSPSGQRTPQGVVLPPYARDDYDNSSIDEGSDVDFHVLAAARARAAGTGGLGLGSGFAGDIPAGSVIRIEEESLGTAIAGALGDDDRFGTMRSNRSARSDERSGTLTRSKSTAKPVDTGLDRSLSSKSNPSKSKRTASTRRTRDRSVDPSRPSSPPPTSPTYGQDTYREGPGPSIPPPPMYTITVEPPTPSTPTRMPSHDLYRQRSNKSLAQSDSLPRPSRPNHKDSSDQIRAHPRERSSSKHRARSASRRRGSSSSGDEDTPVSVLRANSRRRASSRHRSESRRRDRSRSPVEQDRSVRRERSRGQLHKESSASHLARSASRRDYPSGRSSPSGRGGSRRDDEDTPLATVALQALQQNLVQTSPTSPSSPSSPNRNLSMRKSRSQTKLRKERELQQQQRIM
ncbi:hypothetical protein HK097_010065, partial [Rhizophlyctis rosea]